MTDQVFPQGNSGNLVSSLPVKFTRLIPQLALLQYCFGNSNHHIPVIIIIPGDDCDPGDLFFIFIIHPQSEAGK